jgi:hypothetical protein
MEPELRLPFSTHSIIIKKIIKNIVVVKSREFRAKKYLASNRRKGEAK